MKALGRRRVLGMAVAALAGLARAAEARRYAVISLLGDQIDLVYANVQLGSHLDRNVHRPLADADGSFDKFALAATEQAIAGADSTAKVTLLSLPPGPFHERPEQLLEGNSLALPGSVVSALEQAQATHVVLLTKHRGEASLKLLRTYIGVGMLRGLGYYIDPRPNIRVVQTGETGQGVLAPFAYVRLTLADARHGAVLRQRTMAVSRVFPVAASKTAVDPWEVLGAEQKVARLRQLLERELAREVPLLLKPD